MLTAAALRDLERALDDPAFRGAEESLDRALPRLGRRSRGAYFTPWPLVELIVAEAVRARFEAGAVSWRGDGTPVLRVLDPAAGDGRFLQATATELARRAAARGADRAEIEASIRRRCLIGIERDPEIAASCREAVSGAEVRCDEALIGAADLEPVDIVVGNPPYQRSIHLAQSDPQLWQALKGRYQATSHGEWDLYAAFLEQSLAWTGPLGQVGLVVPSRWLTAAYAARLRRQLARDAAVRAIVDFGAAQIFGGATTYPSVVFLSRRPSSVVSVVRRWEGRWRDGAVEAASLDDRPWRLSVGDRRGLIDQMARSGRTLGDVARIVKGAGTNADRVYVLEPVKRRGQLVRAKSTELGSEVELEAALCRPVYRGRDVRGAGQSPTWMCLVPYDAGGNLIEPDVMAARFPRALEYFERCRSRLDAREKGRFAGPAFYRFGRPQNLQFFADPAPKVVVPDVARAGRAVLDVSGGFVLDSAYAVRLRDGVTEIDLPGVAAILSSPAVTLWLRETGIPLRGGYLRMKTAYLDSLPLPEAIDRDALDSAEAPSEVIRESYGIGSDEWYAA